MFEKLNIEVANWTEELALAEVGQEGYFDYKGMRVFWRKWGTNPNDWDIISIQAIDSNVTVQDIQELKEKLNNFGMFENNTSLLNQISKIENNVLANNKPVTPTINRIPTIKNLLQKLPGLINPINFKQPKQQLPTTPKIFNLPQLKKFIKPIKIVDKPHRNWIIKFDLNIFKKWIKPIKKLKKVK